MLMLCVPTYFCSLNGLKLDRLGLIRRGFLMVSEVYDTVFAFVSQIEEARLAREMEAHEKKIRKELEKQDVLRRKVLPLASQVQTLW